jgi:uncharacterized protein YndB with AHSA1/START domain
MSRSCRALGDGPEPSSPGRHGCAWLRQRDEGSARCDDQGSFTTGNSHSFGGEYVELVPHERLRYTDKFDDPNLPGQIQVTVILKKVSLGTELNIVQEGLPDIIPPEACYLGWQESLRNLAKLVEPEINQEHGGSWG